jgi:hypothetical protein
MAASKVTKHGHRLIQEIAQHISRLSSFACRPQPVQLCQGATWADALFTSFGPQQSSDPVSPGISNDLPTRLDAPGLSF